MLRIPFVQSVAERAALVEDETFAAPAAVSFRDTLQIVQDAALQMIDLGETAREQIARCLFAADAAGAEHGDFPVPCRIEMARDEFLELPEACDRGVDGAFKSPDRDF